jgi:hypothetical protein
MHDDVGVGTAARRFDEEAYLLDLPGDSQNGLGRHKAAIEAYRQAAEKFQVQGAQCSYALCLLKIAGSYLSLDERWASAQAMGYLTACLPMLRDLGLVRHQTLAQHQLDACTAVLAEARLLGEGRVGSGPARPAKWRGFALVTAGLAPG